MGEDGPGDARQVLAEAPGAGERALRGVDRAHRVHAAAEAVDRLPGIADPDRRAALGLEDGQGDRVGVLGLVDIEHGGPVRQPGALEVPHLQVGVVLERHRAGGIAHPGPEPGGPRRARARRGPSPAAGAAGARAPIPRAVPSWVKLRTVRDHAVAPEGRAQAVEGRDRQQLGHLAAGELALEAVLLLEHPHRPEGQAVHGAAGDMGGEAGLGRELGALVVGEVEARGGVGLGEEAAGRWSCRCRRRRGRAASRRGRRGVPRRWRPARGWVAGRSPGAPRRRPRIGRPAGAARGRRHQIAGRQASDRPHQRTVLMNQRAARQAHSALRFGGQLAV